MVAGNLSDPMGKGQASLVFCFEDVEAARIHFLRGIPLVVRVVSEIEGHNFVLTFSIREGQVQFTRVQRQDVFGDRYIIEVIRERELSGACVDSDVVRHVLSDAEDYSRQGWHPSLDVHLALLALGIIWLV